MARATTLSRLEDMVRWQSDMQEAEVRHTPSDLRRAINQSIQRYRERISDNGAPYFLKSYSDVMTPGPATDDNGRVLSWGKIDSTGVDPEIQRVYGLDITVNGVNEELDAVNFAERNHFQFGNNETTIPVAYFMYDESQIGVLPPPDRTYEYSIWYLPVLAELTEDDDEFNPGIAGGEEWVVWDVMVKLLNRDNYPRLLQAARAERNEVWANIERRAHKRTRSTAVKRIDTRGRTRNKRNYFYRHWMPPSN